MLELSTGLQLDWTAQPVDDCWRRIGVHGDRSCAQLAEHIHCRNCPTHSAAAVSLLDRYALREDIETPVRHAEEAEPAQDGRSRLIFRIGDEWLGLPSLSLVEVAPVCPVHSLPHQRSPVLIGVANVRGALVACIALGELLGLAAGGARREGRHLPRMLILAAPGGPIVAPVDEVAGIHALSPAEVVVDEAPQLFVNDRFTRGVVHWRSRSVRLLQEEELLEAATRSLA
ncbi:CheW-like domain protein [compost metagenome]